MTRSTILVLLVSWTSSIMNCTSGSVQKLRSQTNGANKRDVKEVIKKQLENGPKRKGNEKNANDKDRANATNVD